MIERKNIYSDIKTGDDEIVDILYSKQKNISIKRIISSGQTTPEKEWLANDDKEWVILLEGKAKIAIENENKEIELNKGDYIYIPEKLKHRVTYTSVDPLCVWLAIHFI